MPRLRVRALCNNHPCWRKGDTFPCNTNPDGTLWIECNDPSALAHSLLTEDDHYATSATIHLCPDIEVIQ